MIPPEEKIGLAPNPGVSPWMLEAPGSVAYQPWADVRSRQDVIALQVPFPYGRMPDRCVRTLLPRIRRCSSDVALASAGFVDQTRVM